MTPDLGQTGVVGRTGQPEVGDLDVRDAVLQEDVGRLDVAVDQPHGVGGSQPSGDLLTDSHDLDRLQRPGAIESLLQRFSGDDTP